MRSREGLRHARAIRQQLQELQAGRATPNMLPAMKALHNWTGSRRDTAETERQPLSPELHSVLQELIELLADVAVALAPAASGAAPLRDGPNSMVSACCSLLTTLLMLCKLGLQLAEREALVLLTVGALPLQVNLSGSLSKDHEVMVGCCCSAVHVLVYMSDADTPLPPRAATAARRTVLRPQALASWLAHAATVFSRAVAQESWGFTTRGFVVAVEAVCGVPGVPKLLQPPAQEALVSLAAAVVATETEAAHQEADAPILEHSFRLPLALDAGRLRHEQNSGSGLLAAVAGSLAARLEAAAQHAQRDTDGPTVQLVVHLHLVLMAVLLIIASSADATGKPAHPQLLQAAVGALPRVLVALHRLSDLVGSAPAAAGAGSAGSGGGGQAEGGCSGHEAEAPAALSSFAETLLRDPEAAEMYSDGLISIMQALATLDALKENIGSWASSEACAAALAATDGMLRLLPRLPHWPVAVEAAGGQPCVIAAHAVPVPAADGIHNSQQHNLTQALGRTLNSLSFTLCATAANSQLGGGDHAAAAFHAAMAACKWEQWQAGQQGAGAMLPAKLAGRALPMHPACLAAQRLGCVEHCTAGQIGGNAEREAQAQRRLDCVLLTYIEALTACPAGMSSTTNVVQRMLALSEWVNWRRTAVATDLLLADGCRGALLLMQTLADALADATCPNETVISILHFVLERAGPDLLPVAAATPDLLRQLAAVQPGQLGSLHPSQNMLAEPTLTSIVRSLLLWLQRCAHEHRAAGSSSGSTSGSGGSNGSSSPAVDKLIEVDVGAASLPEMGRLLDLYSRSPLPEAALLLPQPEASADDLALRRARALALRACANPRCTKLAGDSEAGLKGRRCSGCHLARYCCEACSKQDWQAHKRACRLLSAARTVGG